jgi:hypothetical protein
MLLAVASGWLLDTIDSDLLLRKGVSALLALEFSYCHIVI